MKKQILSFTLLLALSAWVAQAANVKGTVSDTNGKPIQGVVVTDGFNFSQTDGQGRYDLDSDPSRSRFVYLSVPADYEISHTRGIPDLFYQELDKAKETGIHDFTLTPRKQSLDAFVFLAISDPQMMNDEQMRRFREETVADLKQTIDRFNGKEVYGMALGDITGDRMDLYTPYKEAVSVLGIPMFSVIGNHDHDLRYPALSNQTIPEASYAERIYEDHFGPYNYSVNIGGVHIVTLKDIDYYKGKKYDERFGKQQLEWLKKDLSYVKPGTLVFLNVHAPVFNKTDKGGGNAEDAEALKEILAPYNAHIFAGHTHFYENNQVTPTLYEHNIGAACGAWWAGHVNRCGAPNGYLVVEVNGNTATWRYKATGQEPEYQFRVYQPGEFKSQPDYLVVNVWDWDPTYQVKWSENGTDKGDLERFDDEDQAYIDMHGKPSGYHTSHLFRCRPSSGATSIRIEVSNRFGQTFTQNVTLP